MSPMAKDPDSPPLFVSLSNICLDELVLPGKDPLKDIAGGPGGYGTPLYLTFRRLRTNGLCSSNNGCAYLLWSTTMQVHRPVTVHWLRFPYDDLASA